MKEDARQRYLENSNEGEYTLHKKFEKGERNK